MAETLVIDPTSEDATNVPLTLTTDPYGLLEHHYPQPPIDPQWASSASTEGAALASNRYQNRAISITVDVNTLAGARTLQAKLAKLHRVGGTLQRTMSDGTVGTFDILTVEGYDPSFDQTWHLGGITQTAFTFTCKPGMRGPEETVAARTELSLPANVYTVTGVKGELPALGRLQITDAQAQDQRWVAWGVENNARYDTSAATAPLFMEAESRTLLGPNVTTTAGTGASGTIVQKTALSANYQAFLSTQASGGSHLTHVGAFHVYARCQFPATNTGTGSVALEWATGDFRRRSPNPAVSSAPLVWTGVSAWVIMDLGVVTLPAVPIGTQRWEGRLVAKSTVPGDQILVDWLMLIPADCASGVARAVQIFETPTSVSAADSFAQTAGALTGKTLTVGGTWAGAGDLDDFTVTGSGTAQRTATADTNGDIRNGRWAIAGASTFTNIFAQVTSAYSVDVSQSWGVFARYVDINNWVAVRMLPNSAGTGVSVVNVIKAVAGTLTGVDDYSWSTIFQPVNTNASMRLLVDDAGRVLVWVWLPGITPSAPVIATYIPELQTGGTLATGKVGFWDFNTSIASTRTFDDFVAAVPAKDAAMFASQTLEIRSNTVIREDSAGAFWTPVSSYEGDYLQVPVAGAEGRTVRIIGKASRTEAGVMPDVAAADDLTLQLFYTPRYLAVPSA